jgi:methylenetetrahydrofolate dehydrogenase (NADP+)/methenyltetrahydrofolate cyclohydrolase
MFNLIDGKKTASDIKAEIAAKVAVRTFEGKKVPHLAAILVGDNRSSETYVNNKVKDCCEVGFKSTLIRLGKETAESELLEKIAEHNENADVDGFIVQLTIPPHISKPT